MAKKKIVAPEELGTGTAPAGTEGGAPVAPAPEAPAAPSKIGTVDGRDIISIRRHDGSGNPQLRNRLVVKLSDLSESIKTEAELPGVALPPVLEDAKPE